MTADADVVTPEKIRAKFAELQGEVESGTESVKDMATTIGAAVVVVVVVGVFLLGLRKGRKRTTVVEIRRV